MIERRKFLISLAGAMSLGDTLASLAHANAANSVKVPAVPPSTEAPSDAPPFVRRGLPGPFHLTIKALEGQWRVDKRIYIAIGSREKPAISDRMMATREWFGGGKHLRDITQGALAGSSYYRLGVLGFSNVDSRYEWVTFDGLNANMMLYRSGRMQHPSQQIELTGVFTDQGLLGEEFAGKEVAMRTTIGIESADRHVIELYFTPPGRSELLIDRSIYTRA
jgi:hypothetical protein